MVKKSGEGSSEPEVTELTAKQRMVLFDLYNKKTNPVMVQAHVIKMGSPEHASKSIETIMDMPGQAFDKLSARILDISGLGTEAEAKAKKK